MDAEARVEGFALSPYQRRVYHLLQQGFQASYRSRGVVEVKGLLDLERLARALDRVTRRHEILRTRFERVAGLREPIQVIAAERRPTIASIETRPGVSAGRAARLALATDTRDHDSVGAEPREFSVHVATGGPGDHAIVLDLPALCADGRSLALVVRELAAAYAGTAEAAAGAETLQYADFAEWQNQSLAEAAAEARDYWQRQWTGEAVPRLPGLALETARDTFAPRQVSATLAPALVDRIAEVAAAHGCAPDAVVLAAWYILLWRLGGQDTVVVGVACDGRGHPQLADAIGLFAACVPLQQRLRRGLSVADVVRRIADALPDVEAWQPTFAWDLLKPADAAAAAPYLPFAFERVAPVETHDAGGVSFTLAVGDVLLDRFELKLRADLGGAAPALTLDYDSTSCPAAAAAHLLALLDELLAGAVADPSQPIERVNLVGPDERRRLVDEWNRTVTAYPADRSMHELFAGQAAKTPAAVAAICGDRRITYQDLDARAARLARRLQSRGVGPDAIVAICAERSIDLLAGLLGVLKAGGAYLPLDPAYPAKRLAFMLDDSGARVLLADAATAPLFAGTAPAIVRLDDDDDGDDAGAVEPTARARPENLAYVIYTSGSTGTPKGTLIPHRGLVNYLTWCLGAYPVAAGSGALVHSSISFDLTITGLLAPLVAGGTVRLLRESRGADALGAALAQERDLSLVKLTPSHLRVIDQQLDARDLGGRARALVIGGENLTADHLAAWRTHAPATRLFNEYGPTETVVGCCLYEIDAQTAAAGAMPIGRPIANTTVYVLDAAMQLAPIGVPGELYVGGAGVARGYLGRAALTAARFVADPFGAPGGRLYRTGDLVRYDAGGTLHYLGRIDHQVKIRGMRIELQEIEAVLDQHADVRASAVVPKARGADDTRLVAYVVPRDAAADADRAAFALSIKAFVAQALPAHMAPASYVVMKALPLTANGKVNRDALPDPDADASAVRPPYVAPRGDVERLLADVWQQALHAGRVGIDDDFFALGGNSLLCFQIIHKLHQAGYRLTLHQMFAHQSIRALAPVLEPIADAPAVRHDPVVGPVPLTPIQHWFFAQSLANPDRFTQSVVLTLDRRLDAGILRDALAHVVAHHDAFRARFVHDENGWRQTIVADGGVVPVDVIVCDGARPDEAALDRAARAMQDSLSLAGGPLVRVAVVDGGPEERTRLIVACHHIAIDAVSWRILIEDLYAAYESVRQGAAVRLAQTTPFGRWAERLDAYAATPALAAEAAHWLADEPAVVPLPRDREDGPNVVSSTAAVTVALDEAETRALVHDLPRAFGTRINDVLLTAVAGAVCAWTDQPAVLIDLESHGRDHAIADVDLSRTIGWFTTLHPVRLSPTGGGVDALRAVSAQLQRVPNGGFGYGALRYLGRDAALADRLRRQPRADIVFNYVGVVDAPLSGAGVAVSAEHQSAGIDGGSPRSHLLDLVGEISGGCLRLHWSYSRHLHDAATIERVAHRAIEILRSLVADAPAAHTSEPTAGGAAPANARGSLADKVLVGLQPLGSARPLFLAHPSGGMSTVYTDAIAHLGTSRPVFGFQSKGWYPGEEPDTDLLAMTASYVDVMRAVQPAGPYFLAGWSAGGIVAFEMARQLRSRGEAVAFLGIIDQPPPQPDAVWQTDEMLLESMLGHHLPDFAERTAGLTPEARLAYALEQAKHLRFVPDNSDLAQARRLLHIFRITQIAVRAYVPSVFDGSAVLFRAEQQPAAAWADDPTFGWDRYVTGNVQVHRIPGHHQNVLEEPRARVLGELLRSSLDHAEASHVEPGRTQPAA